MSDAANVVLYIRCCHVTKFDFIYGSISGSHVVGQLKFIYSVFQKSDAKIEITITATNLIRIKFRLSSFNYHHSGTKVANFNKIHCTVFEQQVFKNGTQKQKFPIWKSRLNSSYAIPSVTVCAQSVSCADRKFSAAAGGLPVCRPCSVNLPQKSVQC